MKWTGFSLVLTLIFLMILGWALPSSPEASSPKISSYEGKLFTGPHDPDYKDYDLALQYRLISRIQQRYGVVLSPGSYSGYDLLEIESLIRVKKPHESLDPFLKMFPKSP